MKKRIILPLILSLAFVSIQTEPAHAGFLKTYKAQISKNKEYKNTREDVKKVFEKQDEYTNSHNLEKLSELYSEDFVNTDGFGKKVYFQLIKDTWDTYSDIIYSTVIRDIQIDGDFATVQTYETALATTHEQSDTIDAFGELRSTANSIYYLKKFGEKWKITAEQILNEKSQLKYGDARFIKMDLTAPNMINAGQEYTASLNIELGENESAIASIENQEIIHPLDTPKEIFRQLGSQNELERIFNANKKNINEYATASIGIAKAVPYDETRARVYVSGIAFLMTRVNVIPENKYITVEEDNAQKTE